MGAIAKGEAKLALQQTKRGRVEEAQIIRRCNWGGFSADDFAAEHSRYLKDSSLTLSWLSSKRFQVRQAASAVPPGSKVFTRSIQVSAAGGSEESSAEEARPWLIQDVPELTKDSQADVHEALGVSLSHAVSSSCVSVCVMYVC